MKRAISYDNIFLHSGPGRYLYVSSLYTKEFQEVAKLVSPMITVPVFGCLSFYYQRNQSRGNFFSVFTRDQLGHYEEIWRPDVYTTSAWALVQVDIKVHHPSEVSPRNVTALKVHDTADATVLYVQLYVITVLSSVSHCTGDTFCENLIEKIWLG